MLDAHAVGKILTFVKFQPTSKMRMLRVPIRWSNEPLMFGKMLDKILRRLTRAVLLMMRVVENPKKLKAIRVRIAYYSCDISFFLTILDSE